MAGDETPQSPDRYGELWADAYDDEYSFMVPPAGQLSVLTGLARGGRVLELGIGTGRVALPLAARGVSVEGLDASPSMVARLRSKPGGHAIPVTMGDMAELPVDGRFHLVYVVFNTFFNLLTQRDQVSCFKRVASVLELGGAFVLECFVPDPGRYDRGQSLRTISVNDHAARLDASRHDPIAQQIAGSIIRLGTDSVSLRPVRLRYVWPAELDLMAEIAGMRLRYRWGGWNREEFAAASTTHVSVYEPNPAA